jgi:hypothetical protein
VSYWSQIPNNFLKWLRQTTNIRILASWTKIERNYVTNRLAVRYTETINTLNLKVKSKGKIVSLTITKAQTWAKVYSSVSSLLSRALNGDDFLASRPGRFTPEDRFPFTYGIQGWMHSRICHGSEQSKISLPSTISRSALSSLDSSPTPVQSPL